MKSPKLLHTEAMEYYELAQVAGRAGIDDEAKEYLCRAFELEREAAELLAQHEPPPEPTRSVIHRGAASLAMQCGELDEAERLLIRGLEGDPPQRIADQIEELLDQVRSKNPADEPASTAKTQELHGTAVEGQGETAQHTMPRDVGLTESGGVGRELQMVVVRSSQPQRIFNKMPHFPKGEIFRRLGGSDERLGSRQTIRKVQAWTKELAAMVEPKVIYTVEPIVEATASSLELKNGVSLKSSKLARALRDSFAVVCFVATLGSEIEETINLLSQRDKYSEAAVVDAVGSAGTESLVESFHRDVERRFRSQGHGVTLRFSPGYCDWPISEQVKVFKLVNAQAIGVKLLDSGLLIPCQSASGVFGITRTIDATPPYTPYNPCLSCKKMNCTARRKRKSHA
jgi:hypothetical protein